MNVYKKFTQSELDDAYDNSKAVKNSSEILMDFERKSQILLEKYKNSYQNVSYGIKERNNIDIFYCRQKNAPLFVFIHGGYWQMRCKETFFFLAKGLLENGFDVAFIGYTLAPENNLSGIVEELKCGLNYLNNNSESLKLSKNKVCISGWSAGGHLAAMMLNQPSVIGAISISGIFDLEPIYYSYLNEKLKLEISEIQTLSPIYLPLVNKPLYTVCGSGELDELQQQSWNFAHKRALNHLAGGAITIDKCNHFTILEELEKKDSIFSHLYQIIMN